MGIIFVHKQGCCFLQQTRDMFIKRPRGIFPQSNGVKFIAINGGYFYITYKGLFLLQGTGYYFYINDRVSFYSTHKG